MDDVFKALADETRRTMLDKLLASPGLTLTELIKNTDMARQSASKHIRILERAGLVAIKWSGREKLHYLNPVPIQNIADRWVDKYARERTGAILALKAALEDGKD